MTNREQFRVLTVVGFISYQWKMTTSLITCIQFTIKICLNVVRLSTLAPRYLVGSTSGAAPPDGLILDMIFGETTKLCTFFDFPRQTNVFEKQRGTRVENVHTRYTEVLNCSNVSVLTVPYNGATRDPPEQRTPMSRVG